MSLSDHGYLKIGSIMIPQGDDHGARAELEIHIRVSYRTLLIVFLIFSIMHRLVNLAIDLF